MERRTIEAKYKKLYKDLNFERSGLFRLLRDMLGNGNVLYPGSGIHITPSFYFRSVAYVDSRKEVSEFFSDLILIRSVIDSEKNYKEESEVIFFQKDYLDSSFSFENNYDLLICLHAPYCFPQFAKNLPKGSHYLTNDFEGSAKQALGCENLKLKHQIHYSAKGYQILSEENRIHSQKPEAGKKGTQVSRKNEKAEILDRDDYFLFSVL